MRKKPTFLPGESPTTSPPTDTPTPTDPGGRSGAACKVGQIHRQLPLGSDNLTRVLHLPDQVLGLDPGGLHPSSNDGRASDINAPDGQIRNQ